MFIMAVKRSLRPSTISASSPSWTLLLVTYGHSSYCLHAANILRAVVQREKKDETQVLGRTINQLGVVAQTIPI